MKHYNKVTLTSKGDYFFIEFDGFIYCTKGIKSAFALLKQLPRYNTAR